MLTRDIHPIEQVILPAFTKLCIIYEGLREEEDGEPDMIPPERILGVLLEYADPAHVVFVLFLCTSNGSLTIVLHRGERHKDQVRDDPHVKLALDMIEKVAAMLEGREDSTSFSRPVV